VEKLCNRRLSISKTYMGALKHKKAEIDMPIGEVGNGRLKRSTRSSKKHQEASRRRRS
jgi:hypothetical protein